MFYYPLIMINNILISESDLVFPETSACDSV